MIPQKIAGKTNVFLFFYFGSKKIRKEEEEVVRLLGKLRSVLAWGVSKSFSARREGWSQPLKSSIEMEEGRGTVIRNDKLDAKV